MPEILAPRRPSRPVFESIRHMDARIGMPTPCAGDKWPQTESGWQLARRLVVTIDPDLVLED